MLRIVWILCWARVDFFHGVRSVVTTRVSVLDKLKFHVFSLLWKVFLIQRRYSLSSNSQLS